MTTIEKKGRQGQTGGAAGEAVTVSPLSLPTPNSTTDGPARQADMIEFVEDSLGIGGNGHGPKPLSLKTSWSAGDLLAAQFPAAKWAIQGLIPEGLTILAGRPKLGKSWLALQAAGAVGSGGKFFGRDVERGKVLYLALEDSPRSLQKRLELQNWRACDVDFEFSWPDLLKARGLEDLQTRILGGGYTFVVIDTLARAVHFRQNEIEESTDIMDRLQRLAIDNAGAILCLDHHRKKGISGADEIDDILGSTGKAAVADCVLGLYRERGQKEAVLRGTGRELADEVELSLRFDKDICEWQCLGNVQDMVKSDIQRQILELAEESGAQGVCTGDLAKQLGKDKGNLSKELTELVGRGMLVVGAVVGHKKPYLLPEFSQEGKK